MLYFRDGHRRRVEVEALPAHVHSEDQEAGHHACEMILNCSPLVNPLPNLTLRLLTGILEPAIFQSWDMPLSHISDSATLGLERRWPLRLMPLAGVVAVAFRGQES